MVPFIWGSTGTYLILCASRINSHLYSDIAELSALKRSRLLPIALDERFDVRVPELDQAAYLNEGNTSLADPLAKRPWLEPEQRCRFRDIEQRQHAELLMPVCGLVLR